MIGPWAPPSSPESFLPTAQPTVPADPFLVRPRAQVGRPRWSCRLRNWRQVPGPDTMRGPVPPDRPATPLDQKAADAIRRPLPASARDRWPSFPAVDDQGILGPPPAGRGPSWVCPHKPFRCGAGDTGNKTGSCGDVLEAAGACASHGTPGFGAEDDVGKRGRLPWGFQCVVKPLFPVRQPRGSCRADGRAAGAEAGRRPGQGRSLVERWVRTPISSSSRPTCPVPRWPSRACSAGRGDGRRWAVFEQAGSPRGGPTSRETIYVPRPPPPCRRPGLAGPWERQQARLPACRRQSG